jgi:hypothetical protein
MPDLPIVCTLPSPELRARRNELVRFVAREARERTAHGEGYRLRFEPDWALLRDLLELIEVERHCCAFLTFRLEVTPGNGPVWLEISGPPGTRNFLETELGLVEQVA